MDLSWVKELEFLCFWIGMVPKFPQLHHPNETQTLVDIRLGINMKWTWDLLARCRKAYYRYKVLAIDFQKLRISNQKSRFTQRNGTNILPKKLETQETKNRPCGGGGDSQVRSCEVFFIQMEFNQYGQANQSHGDPCWPIFFRVAQAPHRKLQPTQKVQCKGSLEVTTRKKTRTSNFCWCSKDLISASKILQVLWPLKKYVAEIVDDFFQKS